MMTVRKAFTPLEAPGGRGVEVEAKGSLVKCN